jgi:hypothetical protein
MCPFHDLPGWILTFSFELYPHFAVFGRRPWLHPWVIVFFHPQNLVCRRTSWKWCSAQGPICLEGTVVYTCYTWTCWDLLFGMVTTETHRRIRRKLKYCLWSLVFGLQPGGRCKLYPCTVSTPIDTASNSLIFRKIPVMVRCIITRLERREGFA